MRDPARCIHELVELAGVSIDGRAEYDWAEIERTVGLRLPEDYKLFSESFPGGWFRRFVRVGKPDHPDGASQQLDGFAMSQLETLRAWRAEGHGEFPYPLYPEPGGLLPWGAVRAGGYGFWLTDPSDAPEGWPVVTASQQCDHWARFDGTLCEFLIEVAAGRYDASRFTEGPVRVMIEQIGPPSRIAQPIVLAERPVFEPDSVPVPDSHGPRPSGTQLDFWQVRLRRLGSRLAVNEMATLRELIGPPPAPARRVEWRAVHERLGFTLPADYREFVDAYGPGTLGEIRITAPGAGGMWDLFALLDRKYSQVCDLSRNPGTDPPFYPEPGGTVCWGEAAEGWNCAWAPVGPDPQSWYAVAIPPTLRGFRTRAGISFSSMLAEHAAQGPGARQGLVPLPEPDMGPVTFTPHQS